MNEFETYAIVEIPKGSMFKYEVSKLTGELQVDRPLPSSLPYNYGYIPNTLHADGDPLDVCIIGHPIQPLARVKVRVHGALLCKDNGDDDHKLVATVVGDDQWDLPFCVPFIRDYLANYKKGFEVGELVSAEAAMGILDNDRFVYNRKLALEK